MSLFFILPHILVIGIIFVHKIINTTAVEVQDLSRNSLIHDEIIDMSAGRENLVYSQTKSVV